MLPHLAVDDQIKAVAEGVNGAVVSIRLLYESITWTSLTTYAYCSVG